jgi:hypothetical protein
MEVGSSLFHEYYQFQIKYQDLKLMHLMVYEVNVSTSFKNLNNVKLCTPFDASPLNPNNKMNSINFI